MNEQELDKERMRIRQSVSMGIKPVINNPNRTLTDLVILEKYWEDKKEAEENSRISIDRNQKTQKLV